jgi:hypothetical protein
MPIEDVPLEERPQAVGYFILDTLRSWYQTGLKADVPINIVVGFADPTEMDRRKLEVPMFIAPSVCDDLGALYKILVSVSRGDKGLLKG